MSLRTVPAYYVWVSRTGENNTLYRESVIHFILFSEEVGASVWVTYFIRVPGQKNFSLVTKQCLLANELAKEGRF